MTQSLKRLRISLFSVRRFDSLDQVELDVSAGFDDDLVWVAEDAVNLRA